MSGILTLGGLGLSLSVDAFAAAIGKGADGNSTRWRDALRIGVIFGFFEAITPAIGWAVGLVLSAWIAEVDHWVAFHPARRRRPPYALAGQQARPPFR